MSSFAETEAIGSSLLDYQDMFSGAYTITEAVNLFNKPAYTGTVNITNKRGIYKLLWNIPSSPRYEGIGIVIDDILCVGWGTGGNYGVVVYKVDGGKLKGKWTASNLESIGTEDLEGPPGLSGVYRITSSISPTTHKGYPGNVTINKNGDVYLVTWLLESESYSGVGILEDNLLIIGWGVGQTTGVVYYRFKDRILLGRWTIPQATTIGIENLSRLKRD
jgi:hypothetical protein